MRYSAVGATLLGAVPLTSAMVIGSSVPVLDTTKMSAILIGPGPVIASTKSPEAQVMKRSPGPMVENPSPLAPTMETAIRSHGAIPTIDLQSMNPGWIPPNRHFGHGPPVHIEERTGAQPAPPSLEEEIIGSSFLRENKKPDELLKLNGRTDPAPSLNSSPSRNQTLLPQYPFPFQVKYPNLTASRVAAANTTNNPTTIASLTPFLAGPMFLFHRLLATVFSLLESFHISPPSGVRVKVNETETHATPTENEIEILFDTMAVATTATTTTSATPTPVSTANLISQTPDYFPIINTVAADSNPATIAIEKRYGDVPIVKFAPSTSGATAPPLPTMTEILHILPRRRGKYNQAYGHGAGRIGVDVVV